MTTLSKNQANKTSGTQTALNVIRGLVLYLSFCATGWYMTRGVCAYYGSTNAMLTWVANDVVAFFIGGIVPFALYKFLIPSIFRLIAHVSQDNNVYKVSHALEYTYAGANVLCFLIKLIYIAFPLSALIMDVFVDFVITGGVMVAFFTYVYKKSLVKREYFSALMQKVAFKFLLIYGLVAFLELFTVIMQGV